jgi:hypothetical protein|tara:strand:- start:364 stop:624 length:261 start_codon:yes stop_codon:yes gene_type:complete
MFVLSVWQRNNDRPSIIRVGFDREQKLMFVQIVLWRYLPPYDDVLFTGQTGHLEGFINLKKNGASESIETLQQSLGSAYLRRHHQG